MELNDAIQCCEHALASISALWRTQESQRTPRLAEASSLIERALRKLEKELVRAPVRKKKAPKLADEPVDPRGVWDGPDMQS